MPEPIAAADVSGYLDRERIRTVLAEYCIRLDEYDIDGVGALFCADGTMDQGAGRGGPIGGRAAIVAGMKVRQALFRRTCHQLGQSVIEIRQDTAEALTYVTAWHETWQKEVQVARLRYRDVLARTPDGDWRIAFRKSEAMGVEGFGEAQWNWVARRPPQT